VIYVYIALLVLVSVVIICVISHETTINDLTEENNKLKSVIKKQACILAEEKLKYTILVEKIKKRIKKDEEIT